MIFPVRSSATQKPSFSREQTPPPRHIFPDQIESTQSSFEKGIEAIKTLFHAIKLILAKIFFCFDVLSLQDKLLAHAETFETRARAGSFLALCSWWETIFESLPIEIRRQIMQEYIKSFAKPGTDPTTFAEEHYLKYHRLAEQFVLKLETIRGRNPLEEVPQYLRRIAQA